MDGIRIDGVSDKPSWVRKKPTDNYQIKLRMSVKINDQAILVNSLFICLFLVMVSSLKNFKNISSF